MARRYGLPEAQVAQRLHAGALRVKKDVTDEAAKRLAGELQVLGAVARVMPAGKKPAGGHMTLRPGAVPRPPAGTVTPPAAPAPDPASPPASGQVVAPAGVTDSGQFDLGALANFEGAVNSLSLASVDGSSRSAVTEPDGLSASPADDAFAPPPATAPPELDVAADQPPEPEEQTFAPPASAAEVPLELDDGAPKTTSSTMAAQAPPAPAPRTMADRPPTQEHEVAAPPRKERSRLSGDPPLARHFEGKPILRIVAGVLLALMVSYLPATLYASIATSSRYGEAAQELSADIEAVQGDSDRWDDVKDYALPEAKDRIKAARSSVRTTFALLWLVGFFALSFVWFRFIA